MIDVHTHRLKRNAIVNIDPVDIRQPKNLPIPLQSILYTPSAPAPPTGPQHLGCASALHPISAPALLAGSRPSKLSSSTPILPPGCTPVLLPGYNYSVGIHPWNVFIATPADLRLLRALAADPRVLAIGECGLDPNLPATHHPASSPASTAPFPSPNLPAISPQSAARERAEAPGVASSSARFVSVEGFSPQSNKPQSKSLQSNNPQSKNPFSKISQKAPSFSRAEILAAQTALLRIHYELSETLRKPLILHIVKSFPEIIALRKQWKPTQPWIIHGFRGKPQLARELLAHGFHLSYGKKYNPASLAITPASRLLRETDEMPI